MAFYAILRSIPSKGIGVLFMFSAILVLLLLPYLDLSNTRGMQFKPLMKITFWVFVANFLLLMKIGGLHPEEPFVLLGQICTFIYFAWFLLVIPMVSFIQQLLYSDKFKTGLGVSGLSEIQPKSKFRSKQS